jgi:Flp pilus assembly protein TadD
LSGSFRSIEVPDSAELFNRAWQHHQANQLPEAEQLYRLLLASDPQHADAWCFLGALCYSLGRMEEAEAHLRRALEIVPSYTTALNYLSMVQAQHGRLDEAAATLQRARTSRFFE